MSKTYWLLKTEPGTYSFDQLLKDGKTNWNGVRNFQARNFLKELKRDDITLIYHSGDEKAVVGIARVLREAYPDPDPKKKGDWVQVDLGPVRPETCNKFGGNQSNASPRRYSPCKAVALISNAYYCKTLRYSLKTID